MVESPFAEVNKQARFFDWLPAEKTGNLEEKLRGVENLVNVEGDDMQGPAAAAVMWMHRWKPYRRFVPPSTDGFYSPSYSFRSRSNPFW